MTKRDKYVLAAILVAALLARAVALVALWDIDPMRGDGRSYFEQSVNFLVGETYTYGRSPGYCAMLGAAQFICGGEPSMTVIRWTNVVLGVVTVLCVYFAGVLTHNRRLGELTALFVALDPRYVTHVVFPIVENGFLPLAVGALAAVIWGIKKQGVGRMLLAGVLMALAALTRSVIMYFVFPAAALILLLGAKRWRGNLVHASVFVLAALLTVAPWTIRNYFYYNRFVPISTDDGAPIIRGNHHPQDDLKEIFGEIRKDMRSRMSPDDPEPAARADINAEMRRRGIRMIIERQPWWVFERIAKAGPRLLRPGGYILMRGGQDPSILGETGVVVVFWVFILTHVVILLLAPIGLARHTWSVGDIVLILFVLYSLAVHVTAHAVNTRFHLPYNWIFMLYAARIFVDRPRWNRKRVVGAVGLMVISVASLVTNATRGVHVRDVGERGLLKQIRAGSEPATGNRPKPIRDEDQAERRPAQRQPAAKRRQTEARGAGRAQLQPGKSESAAQSRRRPIVDSRRPETQGDGSKPSEIDRLRSLGYIDHAEQADDPEEGHGVVLLDEQRSYPGYNLYCSIPDSRADLIDANGRVIRSWEHQPSRNWERCELLSNGDVLVLGLVAKSKSTRPRVADPGYVMRMSWDGETLWKRETTAHHDIELTPRNQILLLTAKRRRVPGFNPGTDIRDHFLTLLSPDGEFLDECSLYDALSFASRKMFTFQPVRAKGKGNAPIDLIHANSVQWLHYPQLEAKHPIYASSNIIITSRHQDTIAIIDWDKKKVVWAWGQGELSGPHEASLLENGNILVLDNALGRPWSRVIELNPLSEEIVWEYKAPNPSDFNFNLRGVVQRLANGNTLITNSAKGEAFEVTADGEVVWRFLSPYLDSRGRRGSIRMDRYESSYVGGIMDPLRAGDP